MQEDNQQQVLPLAPEGIVADAEEENPALLGGLCNDCGRSFFPLPKYCPQCLGPVEECGINAEGIIHSYTVVRTRPPLGLPQPYAVGYIDLSPSKLRVFGLFNPDDMDELAIGLGVRLKVGPLGLNNQGKPCRRPFFSLSKRENAHD